MATAIWSALLFLSMSRSVLTALSRCCPRRGRSFWLTFLDCHKDLHIVAGKAGVDRTFGLENQGEKVEEL